MTDLPSRTYTVSPSVASTPSPEASLQGAILGALGITTVLGVLVAWQCERAGGTVVVTGAIALSTFAYVTAGSNKAWAMLFTGGLSW